MLSSSCARTERDATSWSKGKLQELLVGIVVENEAGRCETSELKRVEGEASCSSRKGKLIFLLRVEHQAGLKRALVLCTVYGFLKILYRLCPPSFSPSFIRVNVSKKKGDGEILKDLMKTAGTANVREALGDYLKALKTEFTMGMILPTKASTNQELIVKRKLSENTLQMVQKFSKSPAVLEAEKGGKFQMFNGTITGEYIELLINRKIVMKWRCRNWPEEHYATVALSFVPTLEQTELQLDCKGVPTCKENMKFCWQKQHFQEIKGLLQLITLNG
ncbi:Activator of 90 kDa heat shock protein ATPase-like protein 2 [Heterocephalus glaber]|uniref:Activator of 90 kDa heat shock protein ATPase-like protein 2 n=2 Tax=Heterocephalus glaber TaxID=10181 RepID=G5C1Z1_HETGA|nr:Activator of 90 kDa heat shock protein ATPase-like protein 2 [Heterocephalus glaber]